MKTVVKEVGIALVLTFIMYQFLRPATVVGRSMEPTLSDGDSVLVSRVAYSKGQPQRGDVIIFKTDFQGNDGKEEYLVKRIVGLPGERVHIVQGKVYINGKELVDSVSKEGMGDYNMDPVKVPARKYFCMGDNRFHSTDSRSETIGCIRKKDILGKAIYRILPIDKVGLIETVI